jgi:hypothetical protein
LYFSANRPVDGLPTLTRDGRNADFVAAAALLAHDIDVLVVQESHFNCWIVDLRIVDSGSQFREIFISKQNVGI